MKLHVQSLQPSTTRYRVKIWEADQPEPKGWAVEYEEEPDDVASGGALLLAHYSDVTFGNVSVVAVEGAELMEASKETKNTKESTP